MPNKQEPTERGPKGGVKHQPGRGHRRKSASVKKRRFQKKAARKRRERQQDAKKEWEQWDQLDDEQKKLRPDLKPTLPRPEHGN